MQQDFANVLRQTSTVLQQCPHLEQKVYDSIVTTLNEYNQLIDQHIESAEHLATMEAVERVRISNRPKNVLKANAASVQSVLDRVRAGQGQTEQPVGAEGSVNAGR